MCCKFVLFFSVSLFKISVFGLELDFFTSPEVDCSNEEKVGSDFAPVDLRASAILVTDCTALLQHTAPGFYPFCPSFWLQTHTVCRLISDGQKKKREGPQFLRLQLRPFLYPAGMGCGASKNAPVSQPAAGAAKTQVDRAASERSGASTVERAPSAPGRTGSDRGERAVDTAQTMSADNGQGMMLAAGAAGAAVGALAGGVPTSGMGSGMGELGKATGEALVELAKTLPFVAPVAFLLCAVASSAATASGARVVPVFPMRGSTRLPKSLWPTWSHARTHARTRTHALAHKRTRAQTHARARKHTHARAHKRVRAPTRQTYPTRAPLTGGIA